ncbi:DUF3775 domain-containing protein [Thioalkalivibrio sp. ARh3]|uniref:DUF3775 domain-containing protein n=1 Tax=Thioalkalivibrio sp. ARh3 TaxID=1158148 RepID=UPI0003755103|nr:DUF3775 domain-containing protein [Thioalkalivibrio sp. ARh3]
MTDESGPLLDMNPDTVQRLIELARDIQGREYTDISDNRDAPSGAETPPDPDEESSTPRFDTATEEFRSTIDDLEPDQQQQVVALFRLGRGDYDIAEWENALAAARDDWSPGTADHLLSHAMLADSLAAGLVALGYSVE